MIPGQSSEAMRDLALWRRAAEAFRAGKCDIVLFSCFNEEDANHYKSAMNNLYPDVPVSVKWMIFYPDISSAKEPTPNG